WTQTSCGSSSRPASPTTRSPSTSPSWARCPRARRARSSSANCAGRAGRPAAGRIALSTTGRRSTAAVAEAASWAELTHAVGSRRVRRRSWTENDSRDKPLPEGGDMKRKLALPIAVLLAAIVGMASAQVTIGVLSPLTGGAAGTGQAQLAGFELALEEINAAGGVLGEPLELIIEDTRADAATGVAAFEKLMTEDGVEFIAGGYSSGVTLALVESFRTFQPVVSWIGGAASGIGNDDFDGIEELLGQEEWFFHVHPWDYQNVEATFGFIEDIGVGSVALLHEDGAFGTPGAAGLEAGVEQMGIPVVLREAFTSTLTGGTGDFRATLSKVGAANPDMLYWIGYDSDAQPLSSQLKELGVAPAYVFGAPPGWPTGIEAAPEMECVMGLIGY